MGAAWASLSAGDNRHRRAHRLSQLRRVRVGPPVMRNLEHVRDQVRVPTDERTRRAVPEIAGQENNAFRRPDADHGAELVVGPFRFRDARRRPERRDLGVGEAGDAVSLAEAGHRDARVREVLDQPFRPSVCHRNISSPPRRRCASFARVPRRRCNGPRRRATAPAGPAAARRATRAPGRSRARRCRRRGRRCRRRRAGCGRPGTA